MELIALVARSEERELFFKLGSETTEVRNHISRTLRQTKGNEIGSLKTKTLINGDWKVFRYKMQTGIWELIDCKIIEYVGTIR